MKITVLAGACGTRLWPMSRELYSKQFLRLSGPSESRLASAYARAQTLSRSLATVAVFNLVLAGTLGFSGAEQYQKEKIWN